MRDNYKDLYEATKNHFATTSSSNLSVAEGTDHKQNLIVTKLVRAFEKAKTSMEYLKAGYDEFGSRNMCGTTKISQLLGEGYGMVT